ncbi:hypothetical protein FXO37_11828 [Capsicum annuum]|nr:hypothetical protein FXO37_11828 [Capsicum annuum]
MEPINELVLHVPVFPIMVTLPLLSVKSYCPSHFLLQLIFCKMTGKCYLNIRVVSSLKPQVQILNASPPGYNKLNINGAFDGLHNLVMRVTYPETPQQPGFLDMLTTLPHFNSTSKTTCTVTWSELSFSQLIATDSQLKLLEEMESFVYCKLLRKRIQGRLKRLTLSLSANSSLQQLA